METGILDARIMAMPIPDGPVTDMPIAGSIMEDKLTGAASIESPMPMGAVLIPASGRKTASVFGIEVDIYLTGEDTNGAFSSYRVGVEPGFGPPLHVHQLDDEAFYVLEGEFEFQCGEQIGILREGSYIFLPRQIPHAFRNVGTKKGYILGLCTPAGHDKFFEAIDQLTASGFDPVAAEAIMNTYGMELAGPPPA